MKGLTRRIALARLGPGPQCRALTLCARWTGAEVELGAWDSGPADLADRARGQAALLAPLLPPGRAAALEVEAGVVEIPERARRRDFIAATSGLSLVGCSPRRARLGRPPPWHGELEEEGLPGDLPLLLAPSAVQTLILHLLEEPGGSDGWSAAGLAVRFTGASPHGARDRPRSGGAEVHALLGNLEQFGFGNVVSRDGRTGNLSIRASRPNSTAPERALVLEGIGIDGAPGADEVPCRAAWSLVEPGGRRLAGIRELRFSLRPRRLLRGARPCGPARPAYSPDPIEGAFWGWAPALLLESRLDSLA